MLLRAPGWCRLCRTKPGLLLLGRVCGLQLHLAVTGSLLGRLGSREPVEGSCSRAGFPQRPSQERLF